MASAAPTVIKKYANRRLYHTGTSTYVTLDDLGRMVRQGEEFIVSDAKTGEDITRSVLGQIIFDQESRGQHLLPIAFLRQLIGFYGNSMQAVLPSYLESALTSFVRNQEELREQMSRAVQGTPLAGVEELVRRNMELYSEAMRMWLPFGASGAASLPAGNGAEPPEAAAPAAGEDEIAALRRQLTDIQKSIEGLAKRE